MKIKSLSIPYKKIAPSRSKGLKKGALAIKPVNRPFRRK